jgi:bacillopeptidase F (M6 metalloprotease family)
VLGVPSPITGSYASQELESDLPGAAHLVVAKTTASPHSGSYMALAGNISGHEPSGDSSFYQELTVPAGGGILNFWHWDYTIDAFGIDYQDAYITDGHGTILQTIFHQASNEQTWLNQEVDLAPYAGQTIRVRFLVHQEGFVDSTAMYVDDVGLFVNGSCLSGSPTPTPTVTPTATPSPTPSVTPTPRSIPTPRARPTPAPRPTPPR